MLFFLLLLSLLSLVVLLRRARRRWSPIERVNGNQQLGVPGVATAPFAHHEAVERPPAPQRPSSSRGGGCPLSAVPSPDGGHHAASTAQASTLLLSTQWQAQQVRFTLWAPQQALGAHLSFYRRTVSLAAVTSGRHQTESIRAGQRWLDAPRDPRSRF